MAQKNRPTLKQQFQDFINRVSPFDGNALIQKTEHLQVNDDLFDSLLNNTDSSDLINSPSAAIILDFSTFDLFRINSSGSGETNFNITVNNLGTGQVARIHITKKNNDTYSFTNAVIGQIDNLKQTGTILSFFVHNINGVLVPYSDMTIPKTNSITDPSDDKIATAKAVSDLKANLEILIATKLAISRFDVEASTPALTVKKLNIGDTTDWNMDTTSNVDIPHGLDIDKIVSVTVLIINDDNTILSNLGGVATAIVLNVDGFRVSTLNINCRRLTGGPFDNTLYDSTSFNRGRIYIVHEQ